MTEPSSWTLKAVMIITEKWRRALVLLLVSWSFKGSCIWSCRNFSCGSPSSRSGERLWGYFCYLAGKLNLKHGRFQGFQWPGSTGDKTEDMSPAIRWAEAIQAQFTAAISGYSRVPQPQKLGTWNRNDRQLSTYLFSFQAVLNWVNYGLLSSLQAMYVSIPISSSEDLQRPALVGEGNFDGHGRLISLLLQTCYTYRKFYKNFHSSLPFCLSINNLILIIFSIIHYSSHPILGIFPNL
jgi:hypothetical protein